MDERIKTILKHYGFDAQAKKTIEEAGELIVAISKFLKSESWEDFKHFKEEVVDVEIMIQQLKFYMCAPKNEKVEYKKLREYKLNRQMKRIKEGN